LVSFIVRRLIQTLVVLLLVTVLSFSLLHMIPGDPVLRILGTQASPTQVEQLRHELGLDKPIIVQYGSWMWGIFHGDLGKSLLYHEDVVALLSERLPVSAFLAFLALLLSGVVGILAGVISAVRRGDILDAIISLFANTAVAIPTFFLGIVGIYIFGLRLGWLPIQGWTSPLKDFGKSLSQLVMPVTALAIPNIAVFTRQTRSSMLEAIHQDYVRTAYSMGLTQYIVLFKYALRNALTPVVTLIGMSLAYLITGAVLVETVFNIPGIGRLLVRAALDSDYLIVQSSVLLIGTIVCLTNLLVDIVYGWIDPRIRYR
jgi:peptide/nickel transport system permease protein